MKTEKLHKYSDKNKKAKKEKKANSYNGWATINLPPTWGYGISYFIQTLQLWSAVRCAFCLLWILWDFIRIKINIY